MICFLLDSNFSVADSVFSCSVRSCLAVVVFFSGPVCWQTVGAVESRKV